MSTTLWCDTEGFLLRIYCARDSTVSREIEQIVQQKDGGFDEICRFLGKGSNARVRLVPESTVSLKSMTIPSTRSRSNGTICSHSPPLTRSPT
jgi:hypothetical protein